MAPSPPLTAALEPELVCPVWRDEIASACVNGVLSGWCCCGACCYLRRDELVEDDVLGGGFAFFRVLLCVCDVTAVAVVGFVRALII